MIGLDTYLQDSRRQDIWRAFPGVYRLFNPDPVLLFVAVLPEHDASKSGSPRTCARQNNLWFALATPQGPDSLSSYLVNLHMR